MAKAEFRGKLKNGNLSYRLRSANGRLKNGRTKYTFKTIAVSKDLSEAKKNKLLEEETYKLEEELKKGRGTNGNIFFSKYAEDWLIVKKSSITPSTYYDYSNTVKRLNEGFGQYKITEITNIMIIKFYEKLRQEGANKNNGKALSEKTLKNIHDVLKNILDCAIEDEIIFRNPITKSFPIPKPLKKEIEFLDTKDLILLAKALKDDQVDLKYLCITRLLIGTGARIGEIQALEWNDIDFTTGCVSITKTIQHIGGIGIIEKAPKTDNSKRNVYIGVDVLNLLKEYKDSQDKEKQKLRDIWHNTIDLYDEKGKKIIKQNNKLFTQWDGKPINACTYAAWLKKLTKRHNLKPYTPHSFRHTFATLSLEEGQPINAISRTLGHSNISTTTNIYVKTTDDAKKELSNVMASKMSDIFD